MVSRQKLIRVLSYGRDCKRSTSLQSKYLLFTRKTCNIRFATFEFQRNEKTVDGKEIYLWYHETEKDWRLTDGSDFQARFPGDMYINSQGKQEF